MLLRSFIPLVLLGVTKVIAATVEISKNTLISTGDTLYRDDYIINAGVYLAIDSGLTHNFYADLTVYGMLYISDRNKRTGMTSLFTGTSNTLKNYGDIVLNDLNGTSAPTFNWNGGNIYNYGNMWFAGIGHTGGSTYNVRPRVTFINEGTITFYQSVSRSGGNAHIGPDDSDVTNDGTVCVYQQIFYQGSNVFGTGCFDVGLDSNFWVTNANYRTIAETQTILLSTSSSSLRIDLYRPTFSYRVAGWGNGNVIGFSGTIRSFTYSGDTLTIQAGSYTYTVIIGTGYDASQMVIGAADFGRGAAVANSNFGLLYPPAPPDSGRPSVCAICPSIPNPPNGIDNDQTTTTSTWTGTFTTTITATDTQGGTDTVIVEVPSNSQTTTTSTWTGTVTSTITETDTQGGTDTVIIVVPTNSQTTTTSTWTGTVTSTITETDTQGGTDTVIIVVPTNSQTTTTSTWTGTVTSTITETDTQGGTDTVIIVVPTNSQTTTTSTWTGTVTSTITETDTQGGTDTVIVVVPTNSQTTTTSTWTGTVTSTITETDTQGGTDTVIIVVPTNSQTTTTSTWTGTVTSTITETDTQGGTDTVIVVVPSSTDSSSVVVPTNAETTKTSTWTGTVTTTITETDTQGGTDTVIIVVPTSSQSTSSSASSTPTAAGCTSVQPSAVGFIGYFYEYTTSDSLTSYLEGGYKSNKLEGTVEAIIDVEIVYDTANTLDLEGYFLPPSSGSYKFELRNIANGAAFSIGADVAFPCGSTLSRRANASPLIIEGPSGTGELTVELVAGIYYPISIVNNYIASGEHIEFVITGPNGELTVDQTIFYVKQAGTSSTGSISSSTTAVSSSSAATSDSYSSSLPTSSFTSSSGYWSNSSVISTYWPSSSSLSTSLSSKNPSVTDITSSATTESDITTTKTDISTTVITVTSCDDKKCTVTPVTTGVTVITITTDEVVTEFTTYCPLPSSTGNDITTTKTDISTTVITVTSCDDKKCTVTPVTTGLTVITVTSDEVITAYTTYCPLPSESTPTNEEDNNYTLTPIVPDSEPKTISTGVGAVATDADVSHRTPELQTVTASSTGVPSPPAIATVSEGKAPSFNIPVIAVFVTYLVHMLL